MVTVQESSDQLWNCQDAEEVYDRLKVLHRALLKERVDTYDPSEAFAAIQGASLRFLPTHERSQLAEDGILSSQGKAPNEGDVGQEIDEQAEEAKRADKEKDKKNEVQNPKGDKDEKEEEESLKISQWSIIEESCWAAATLAGVCVGPAWRTQIHKRRIMLLQKAGDDDHSLNSSVSNWMSPDNHQVGNIRSFSPTTNASTLTTSWPHITLPDGAQYPAIPEALPLEMLCFAASALSHIPNDAILSSMKQKDRELWSERKKKVAIGQRNLVLALCCESPMANNSMRGQKRGNEQENQYQQQSTVKSTEWTIPGSNEIVGNLLLFWLDVAHHMVDADMPTSLEGRSKNNDNQREGSIEQAHFNTDWGYTLGVTRACTDLVSTGWRPLPKINIASVVVKHLLGIAETGISMLDTRSALSDLTSSTEVRHKEKRLVASSSAAEAISALASLGSRGLIPFESQKFAMRTICRLHVISGLIKASMSGVFPLGATQNERLQVSESERKTFLAQIESCFADTADFLWILLATQSSSANAISAFVDTVNAANPNASTCKLFVDDIWDTSKKLTCMEAGTAVRMLGAALWGRPPSIMNTVHLRVHMTDVLVAVRGIAASIHSKVRGKQESGDFLVLSTCDLLSLALDTVVALGNFADRQLLGGYLVSPVEWDTFLLALEEAFVPWLDYSGFSSNTASAPSDDVAKVVSSILERAHLEVQSLLLRVGAFLDKFVRLEGSPFHWTVSYEGQKKLFLFILNTAIPYMAPTDAELLGLSVVRAWVKFGMFPFKLEGSAQTSSEILSEIFSVYENGRYVHSPQVRLQALRNLRNTAENEGSAQSESVGESSGPSEGSRSSQVSRLRMAVDVSVLYKEINKSLIPTLQSILTADEKKLPGQRVIPVPGIGHEKFGQEQGFKSYGVISTLSADSSLILESYAIRLVGKLIRSISTERKKRDELLKLLHSVALGSKWKPSGGREQPNIGDGNLQERFRLQGSIRLEAVHELESCLVVPFVELLHLDEIVPRLIESLRTILIASVSSLDDQDFALSDEQRYERTLVAFAALIPLCRLRICTNGEKLALLSNVQASKYIPDFLLTLLARNGFNGDHTHWCHFSPFLEVAVSDPTPGEIQAAPEMIIVSFEPIVSSVILALGTARSKRNEVTKEMCSLLQIFSSLCFRGLTSYLLSGFQLSRPTLFEDLISAAGTETSSESTQELVSRSMALAALTESTVARVLNQRIMDNSQIDTLLNILLHTCDSTTQTESIIASRALAAVLPSIIHIDSIKINGKNAISTILARVSGRLHREVVALDRLSTSEHAAVVIQETASLLTVLHNIIDAVNRKISEEDHLFCFNVCKDIIRVMLPQPPSYCLHLAIWCMVSTIDGMPINIIESLMSNMDSWILEPEDDKTVSSSPSECFDLTADFVGRLVSELLVERRRVLKAKIANTNLDKGALTNFNVHSHEELALELDNMEKFEVECDHEGKPYQGVWLCGHSLLLTCRIGSSTSRYRGWVEIVTRCPTFRKRVMVRLLSKFSVRNPDIPSSLWSSDVALNIEEKKQSSEAHVDYNTDQVLAKYESLVSRFQSLIPPSTQEDQLNLTGGTPTLQSDKPTSLAGSPRAAEKQFTSRDELEIDENSISGWLKEVLNDDDNVQDVVASLQKSNLPIDLIEGKNCERDNVKVDASQRLYPCRRLKAGPRLNRAIAVLDRTTPSSTHKIALLYAGPMRIGSTDTNPESIMLSTTHCSPAFHRFADGLGKIVPTRHLRYFSAGLDVSPYESDGRHTRAWVGNEDSSLPAAKSIVVYHTVHLMPDGMNNRKRHVGNDNVLIIFVEADSPVAVDVDLSEEESKESIVSGHFGFVTIYVSKLPKPNLARVTVRIRHGLPDALKRELLNFAGNDIIALNDAPAYVRGIAVRADLACRSVLDNLAPASNCYERYRMLWEMNRHIAK